METRIHFCLFSLPWYKNWDVQVWGEDFSTRWTVEFLRGKWYARLKKGMVTCDLSFEYPYLDISKTLQCSVRYANHPMCSLEVYGIWNC